MWRGKMSRGKYSLEYKHWPDDYEYNYNARGEVPEVWKPKPEYCQETMGGGYDEEGFDSYGYSAYSKDGVYVGAGDGIDRAGWTEMDYLTLKDIPEEHRESFYYYN